MKSFQYPLKSSDKNHRCNLKIVPELFFQKLLRLRVVQLQVYKFLLKSDLFLYKGVRSANFKLSGKTGFLIFQNSIYFEELHCKQQKNFLIFFYEYFQIYHVLWNSDLKSLVVCRSHLYNNTRMIFIFHYSKINRICRIYIYRSRSYCFIPISFTSFSTKSLNAFPILDHPCVLEIFWKPGYIQNNL